MYLGKLIDKGLYMRSFKNISICSDGSFYFSYNSEAVLNNKLVYFKKQDDKNFASNQKKQVRIIESKYSSHYKKKYLR